MPNRQALLLAFGIEGGDLEEPGRMAHWQPRKKKRISEREYRGIGADGEWSSF